MSVIKLMKFINLTLKASLKCQHLLHHIGEELWSKLGHEESITYQPWPTYDEALLVDDEVEIVVQVNGKLRAKIKIAKDTSKEEMQEIALSNDNVKASIEGKDIMKVIAVPQKLVNIVAK